jgi:predicted O-methyltransferase YrrM
MVLLDLARECPDNGVVLEIGSYLGASTCYLAAGVFGRGVTIHCVDTWDNRTMDDSTVTDTFAEFQRNVEPVKSIIMTLRMPNTKLKAEDIRLPVDLAFLDADHSYAATRLDFQLVHPWITPRGVIAFHDSSTFEGVSRVIGEVLSTGKWRLAGHVNNLTWIQRADWAERPDAAPALGNII